MDLKTGIDAIIAKYYAQKASNPEKIPCLAFSFGAATGMQNKPLSTALSILSTKKDSATNELMIVKNVSDFDEVDKSIVAESYDLFLISIDGAAIPGTEIRVYDFGECMDDETVYLLNRTKIGQFHLQSYGALHDGDGLHGVSINDKIPTSLDNAKLFQNWKMVRESGTLDFGKSCIPNPDYPFLKLQEMMHDIVARNGAIVIFNDAWWETSSSYGKYFDNMYLENMGEFVNMIWSLPSTQNVWLIYRTPNNERILTPWDDGLYGERAFCLGRGDGRVGSTDTRWYTFDSCLTSTRPCVVTPRIGLHPFQYGLLQTSDERERRKPAPNIGGRYKRTQKKLTRRRKTRRRQSKHSF